jgi:hypothetical protein
LVARLRPETRIFQSIEGNDSCEICAVDYEIIPFRTTGHASFEDGKVGTSGGGGLDLLLQDKHSGLPIIGEIKSPGDVNLFLALMQALVYAVELTSSSQAQRLKKFYKQFAELPCDDAGCCCDVFLFHRFSDTPKLLKQTQKLASHLLQWRDSTVASKIRQIVIVKADLPPHGGVNLHTGYPQ